MALRLLVLAVVAAIGLGLMAVYAGVTSAGVDAKLTVNSVGNTDDGDCEGPPNAGSGDCTLREAINAVNDGLANTINFHKPTFPKANPGVIHLDGGDADKDNADNCLPAITANGVTIDSTNTGVILDGDAQDDKETEDALACDAIGGRGEGVIQVHATQNGFDFTLLGGKNFIIRQFNDDNGGTDGINLEGDIEPGGPYSFGDVLISGIIFQDGDTGATDNLYGSQDGIDIEGTTAVHNVVIDNVDITADDDGVEVDVNDGLETKEKLGNNFVQVTGSRIIGDNDRGGSGDGVDINFEADIDSGDDSINGKITADVSGNDSITSFGEDGVDIEYCEENACEAGGGNINFWVNDNAKIHGGDDSDDEHGIEIDINADDGGPNSGDAKIDVQASGNGLIDAGEGDGINIDIEVCCDGSFSTSSVQVNENDDIIGDDDGVNIDVDLGCGDENESIVEVNDNGSIEGQGESDGDGVDVDVDVGEIAGGCDGDEESDGNVSTIMVNGNERIDGGAEDGVEIDAEVGADEGGGDDNINDIQVDGNGQIDGDDDGVDVDADSGSEDGDDADENTLTISVSDNEDINGSDSQGIEINADSGVEVDLDGTSGDIGDDGSGDQDGDDNLTQVWINGNGSVEGDDGDGVFLNLQAGGETSSSSGNRIDVEIADNEELIGRQDEFGAGIEIDMAVCCDLGGLNTVNIHDNGDIIGRAADGIFMDMCCAGANATNISKNASIRGNGNNGIDYDVDIWSDLDADFTEPCPTECGIFSTTNFLTITNNDIFNSQGDGIEICCGAFQFPTDAGRDLADLLACEQGNVPAKGEGPTCSKSLIANNTIHHNRNHGIQVHSSFGLNIVENEIYSNGDDPQQDRGIEIDTAVSDAIGEDFADFIEGNASFVDAIIEGTRANQNRISMNSIYDNAGLGIDLVGDNDQDGDGDHRQSCVSFADIPSPNDCLPVPIIQTLSGDKLVGAACSLCVVELFVADDTPADQEPLDSPQHGEGRTYITSGDADEAGDWSIDLPCGLGDKLVTATATDKLKNTSEFSANFIVLGIPCTPTPTNTPVPPTATNTPVVPPTATPTTAPAKACGDVNDDGNVNSVDASLILQLKAGLISSLINEPSADVNGSGEITSVDAALILQLEAGLITPAQLNCL